MPWTAVLVNQAGSVTADLDGSIFDVEFVESGHGGCRLVGSIEAGGFDNFLGFFLGDNTIGDLDGFEIQVFRDTDLVGWFVPTSISLAGRVFTIECAGLTWLLDRRVIGRSTAQANQLTNPGFESALGVEWEEVDCTATRDTSRHFVAGASVRLDTTTGTYPDAFLTQSFSSAANGVGVVWTASAWVYIDGTAWTGPAYNGRGLYLEWLDTGGTPTVQDLRYQDEAMAYQPRDQWVRLTTWIAIPPDTDATVRLRLYAAQEDSVVYWDDVQVLAMESATFVDTPPEDIIEYLADLAQDAAVDKDDLAIVTTQTVDRTGYAATTVNRSYQYAEHINTWQAIRELIDSDPDQQLAVRMVCTDTVRTLAIEFPKHATGATPPVLRYGSGTPATEEVAALRGSVSFTRGFNQPIVMSDLGTGVDREEVIVLGTGRVFEEVISGPAGSTIDTLATYATTQQTVNMRPAGFELDVVPTVDVDLLALIIAGTFVVGDGVSLDFYGAEYPMRCVGIRINPGNELVTLTCNPVPV